jgi:hypothetical protein
MPIVQTPPNTAGHFPPASYTRLYPGRAAQYPEGSLRWIGGEGTTVHPQYFRITGRGAGDVDDVVEHDT